MPVIEHDVHPSTRVGPDYRHGCWNRPRPKVGKGGGYYAPVRRYFPDGSFEIVSAFVSYRMSVECRYDVSLRDAWCEGCDHAGSGEAYANEIRRAGK